ncbi:MAG: hypothetical protein U0531_10500 [Dehalococcoidia bacterium]
MRRTTLEEAARLLREYDQGLACGDGQLARRLAGIITTSDIFNAYMRTLGVDQPSTRFEVEAADMPAALHGIADVAADLGVAITGLATERDPATGASCVVVRFATIQGPRLSAALRARGLRGLRFDVSLRRVTAWNRAPHATTMRRATSRADFGLHPCTPHAWRRCSTLPRPPACWMGRTSRWWRRRPLPATSWNWCTPRPTSTPSQRSAPAQRTGRAPRSPAWGRVTPPAFAGMFDVAALIAGGTLAAARAVMRGETRHAFNPGGGLHHAHRDRASGFCIFNDLAVAIASIAREHEAKVMYVDLDVHHGDGVQAAFYDDPRVLTVSFHETGKYLFPGSGNVLETSAGARSATTSMCRWRRSPRMRPG